MAKIARDIRTPPPAQLTDVSCPQAAATVKSFGVVYDG
jgi:hypothetical protein